MKNHIKGALRALVNYSVLIVIFVVFLFIGAASVKIYSIFIVVITFSLYYTEFKSMAFKEKKPIYDVPKYPLKGVVVGLLGTVPLFLIIFIVRFIDFGNSFNNSLRDAVIKIILGPVFGLLTLNPLLLLLIPVFTGIGYYFGYKDLQIPTPGFLKPKPKKKVNNR